MKKTVLIATGNDSLDKEVENIQTINSVHTLKDSQKLLAAIEFLEPQVLVITDNFGDKDILGTLLKKISKRYPNTQILLLALPVDNEDFLRLTEFGSLIERGIYPVFKREISSELVERYVDTPPKLEGKVKEVFDKYKNIHNDSEKGSVGVINTEHLDKGTYSNVVLFSSKKGGAGATFMAINYALTAAKYVSINNKKPSIAIIEANLKEYDLGNSLGIEEDSEYNLYEAAKVAQNMIDRNVNNSAGSQKILRSFKTYENKDRKVSVLSYVSEDGQKLNTISASQYKQIVDVASKNFDIVIIDSSSDLSSKITKVLFELSTINYAVMTMDNNDINNNLRFTNRLKDLHLANKTAFILNKYHIKEYDRFIENNVVIPLMFKKDLLSSYEFNIIATIPYMSPNFLNNCLFNGEPMVLAEDSTTLYPESIFMELLSSLFKVPTLKEKQKYIKEHL